MPSVLGDEASKTGRVAQRESGCHGGPGNGGRRSDRPAALAIHQLPHPAHHGQDGCSTAEPKRLTVCLTGASLFLA